ncbi:hypothetical protein BN8_p06774 (plasmid) [Fibrisoma limi BUZ 3]|uniref:Uncharacterized protein n=1 Tax=Fibrisoma limi BUZ 3 TaxID=1185876 RepID=I2GTY4_9BACT|nr:DUF3945 domain-containing protein [Fibrisoma limi]CCH57585.1 hypothetical protein BN8_p06774 [Fibrisoma limi BUZ 3]
MAKRNNPKPAPSLKVTPLEREAPEAEQLKEQFYELLLPEEFQELRQYLGNDGFLSNDEISRALRDGRLEKDELAEKVKTLNVPQDKDLQKKMVDYLWELHLIVQDPVFDRIQTDRIYRVEKIEPALPLPDTERKVGDEQAKQKQPDRSLEIINGGLLANFLHNFKKAYNLEENPQLDMDKKTRYQWQDVEASLEKFGLTRQMLAETGNLDRLLKGEKTGVIDFKAEYNGQDTPLRGKIYLVNQGEEVKPYFQSIKQSVMVPDQKWGYSFSQEDKDTLKQKGELGKQVELEDQSTKQKFKGYVGVDQETNSLMVWRADRVHIPVQIKGVTLSKEQQETLEQGGAIRLTGLTGENGQKFDADVQVSAGKRSLSFSPPSEAIKQTIDLRTAKEMERTSDQLQGTSAGGATTKDKLPEQKLKKAESKNKGIDPEIAIVGEPIAKKEPTKNRSQTKHKKNQKDQGLSV